MTRRNKTRRGHLIPAGEEGHIVALPNELFRQVRNHPLGTSVAFGGNTFIQRSDLCNSHRILTSMQIKQLESNSFHPDVILYSILSAAP